VKQELVAVQGQEDDFGSQVNHGIVLVLDHFDNDSTQERRGYHQLQEKADEEIGQDG
jgi:hypothetical protein